MTPLYLLDTNTVSNIVKGHSAAAVSRLVSLPAKAVAISSITEAEVHYGLAKLPATHPLHAAMKSFFAKLNVLPWGSREAAAYGVLRATLEQSGRPLGNMDTLIVTHAVAAGLTLVTGDKALLALHATTACENWATDLP